MARDQPIGIGPGNLSLFSSKPERDYFDWNDRTYGFYNHDNEEALNLPSSLFPEITWESDPVEVEITIKKIEK